MTSGKFSILGIVVFAIALATVPTSYPTSAATNLLVGKSNPTADSVLPADVGVRLGFFKQHGLDVELVDFRGGGQLIQAMTAGSVGIGVGAATGMALVAKGAPIVAICENTVTLPYFAIAVPWDSPVHSLKDLKGKKIGISSIGSLTDWMARELPRKEGWPPDAITLVAIGGGLAPATAGLRTHVIDAYIGGTIEFQVMEEKKIARIVAPVSAYIGKVASGAIYASNEMVKTHPDTIRAFLAAWVEITRYMTSHKDETVKIESEILGYPERMVAREYDINKGMFTDDCSFDAESVAALAQSFVALKLFPQPPDMSKLYTEAFLPKH